MKHLISLIGISNKLVLFISGTALIGMMLHVCADITGRVVFNSPLEGTVEIVSTYYMVSVIFLPLAYVAMRNEHITVELFTRHMKPHHLHRLETAIDLLSSIFLLWMAYQGTLEALKRTRQGEIWQSGIGAVEVWPSRWFVVAGISLMALFLAYRGISCLFIRARSHHRKNGIE